MTAQARLVVVSNRVPSLPSPGGKDESRRSAVGGLVSALRPVLERRDCLWFGWSGRSTDGAPTAGPKVSSVGTIKLVTVDLSRVETRLFYSIFANQTLWPLLHSFPHHVVIRQDAYRAFRRINRRYAQQLWPLLREGDLLWVHDFHLFPLGDELRRLGWKGKIGHFLHVPFSPADIFAILPWSRDLLETLFAYDLVGFHTKRFAHNLLDALETAFGGTASNGVFRWGDRSLRVGVHPIGIDPESFARWARVGEPGAVDRLLQRISPQHRVILGVDRLDYTKGVPDRLLAFEHLLKHYPSVRRGVSMVQISAPSRATLPEYINEKERLDLLVGRINGHFAEAGWDPVHYLYRAYTQEELAAIYRRTDVCLVTPLRDGMNLVAKEFVSSQTHGDPGVLVLSEFCGAAETMKQALIVNPYDIEGTARTIYRALRMPLAERRNRWEHLFSEVRTNTSEAWCDGFLHSLVEGDP
ncbi:MAG: trehalose-6-phosphate synthase [Dehalococcoidia bacterium]